MNVEKFLKVLVNGGALTLTVHKCADGGVLYEIYKHPDFGQLAIRTVLPGNTVGGHMHDMHEWWLVFGGEANVRLEYSDRTRWLKNVSGKKPEIIKLPPMTGHDICNIGKNEVVFLFWAEEIYDPATHSKVPWEW